MKRGARIFGTPFERDGPIVFDAPGLNEEDIHVGAPSDEGGGRIRGVVVDEARTKPNGTGEPLVVRATQIEPSYRSWRTDVAADGTFELDGLPAGRTRVQADRTDVAPGSTPWLGDWTTVVLPEGSAAPELHLTVSRGGTMRLRLTGFREEAPRAFSFRLHGDDGSFEVEDLVPGARGVLVVSAGTNVDFPELSIPAGAEGRVPLHLVLPTGRLVSSLFDGRTGEPLGEDGPRW